MQNRGFVEKMKIRKCDNCTGCALFRLRGLDESRGCEYFEKRLRKISDFIDSLEVQSDDWDKLCDCPASENPMNHTKDCMTVKIRKDISELNL